MDQCYKHSLTIAFVISPIVPPPYILTGSFKQCCLSVCLSVAQQTSEQKHLKSAIVT